MRIPWLSRTIPSVGWLKLGKEIVSVIKKLLIANRGEIVVRVMKTCRKLGIKTVAVYSEPDKNLSYLRHADEACHIGPANPIKSYLNMEAILDAVKKSGADAVHPGYGFLSENSLFANAVVSGGTTWVGPPPSVLAEIDSKCYCRRIATNSGVPVVPGTIEIIKDEGDIIRFASEHGYPLVLKLDKGGGGKGIEQIREDGQAKEAFERLSRIGLMAFGHQESYIEQLIAAPRHIEVQFLADRAGHCLCLGERECSIQRRYQKIIEESPSPVVTMEDRDTLYRHTANLVKTMGYQGAGTMEFLRSEDGSFYFMEVNARLQVEHPVSEFLTGIDIVEEQLKIASGRELDVRQQDVSLKGYSIEARIYAEDPVSFFPSPGTISRLRVPEVDAAHLRIDHAIEEGCTVPPYYDPLLAKVISWGESRSEAIDYLLKALSEFQIEGIKTTIPANLLILDSREYRTGDLHTGFLERLYSKAASEDGSIKPLWPNM
ncbi:MAG: biotin carboxylase N-terminal domain-containing protein [Syntrophobacteraceae bacterium]|jgi:acetyl-CoA carboxylase biotin carboxylase subunit